MTKGHVTVKVERATGACLGGSRSPVAFTCITGSRRSTSNKEAFATSTRTRPYLFDFRGTSEVTLEWNETLGPIEVSDISDSLIVQGFKGGQLFGMVKIALNSLPRVAEVSKWYQLHDNSRRNVDALVFLKISISDTLLSSSKDFDTNVVSRNPSHPISQSNYRSTAKQQLFPHRDEKKDLSGSEEHNEELDDLPNIEDVRIADCFCVVGLPRSKQSDILKLLIQDDANPTELISGHLELLSIYPPPALSQAEARCPQSLPSMLYFAPHESLSIQPNPICISYRLSNPNRFVTGLTFWHRLDDHGHSEEVFVPQTWCLIGTMAFCVRFQEFLVALFNQYVAPILAKKEPSLHYGFDGNRIAVEQYIAMLLTSPLLEPGQTIIRMPLPGMKTIEFSAPSSVLALPLLQFSLPQLFQWLDIDAVLVILASMFTGQSIVFHSSQVTILLPICESLLTLCFPLKWSGVYVPVLTEAMLPVIESPVPFIAGTTTQSLQRVSVGGNILLVDIDNGRLICNASLPPLPHEIASGLRSRLRMILLTDLFKSDELSVRDVRGNEQIDFKHVNHSIQIEFLKYTYMLLRDYREFLVFDQNNRPVFREDEFLQHRPDARVLLSRMMRSFMFLDFLKAHVKSPNLLHDYVAYVADESTNNAQNQIDIPLPSPFDESSIEIYSKRDDAPNSSSLPELNFLCVVETKRLERATSTGSLSGRLQSFRRTRKNPSLFVKSLIEMKKGPKTSRVHDTLSKLLNNQRSTFAELSAACDLLLLDPWRDVLAKQLEKQVGNQSIDLSTTVFDDLLYLLNFVLDQCVVEIDYSTAKVILDCSLSIYTSESKNNPVAHNGKVYLRDAMRDHVIWRKPRFWSYVLSVQLLTWPNRTIAEEPSLFRRRMLSEPSILEFTEEDSAVEPQSSPPVNAMDHIRMSRNFSNASSIDSDRGVQPPELYSETDQEEWNNYLFASIGTIVCMLHELQVSRVIADSIVLRLAHVQGLKGQQLEDLTQVIRNVYRAETLTTFSSNVEDIAALNSGSAVSAAVASTSPQQRSQQRRLNREVLQHVKKQQPATKAVSETAAITRRGSA